MPLGPTGHLLCKATLTKPGVTADLPNEEEQAQSGSQNGKKKKQVSNERTKETSRKRAK